MVKRSLSRRITSNWKPNLCTDFSLYQYRVDFSPDEERTIVCNCMLSFLTNPKFSESFRILYPHQTVSF